MKKPILVSLIAITITLLSGCGQNISAETTDELENGISAIEDAMSEGKTADSSQQTETDEVNDLRNGTSVL